jgi:hypothetical protein
VKKIQQVTRRCDLLQDILPSSCHCKTTSNTPLHLLLSKHACWAGILEQLQQHRLFGLKYM